MNELDTLANKVDWDVSKYARFADLRLRPALDLLAQIPALPEGPIVDLGCGAGAVAPALHARFGRGLIGIDTSATMLAQAQETGLYESLLSRDMASWQPDAAPALIFSNAALHWVSDHATVLPALANTMRLGGVLAVQMPGQNDMPSHQTWRSLRAQMFPAADEPVSPGIESLASYHQILSPLGQLTLWETTYVQILPLASEGHPVRQFTSSTYARPYLEGLDPKDQADLIAAYDAQMTVSYPLLPDGSALFPFRRVFMVLQRP